MNGEICFYPLSRWDSILTKSARRREIPGSARVGILALVAHGAIELQRLLSPGEGVIYEPSGKLATKLTV